jgi:hypothetical protein
MRRAAGLGLVVFGTALAVYAVPFVTFVAFGAFLAGVAMAVYGIVLVARGAQRG